MREGEGGEFVCGFGVRSSGLLWRLCNNPHTGLLFAGVFAWRR